MRAEGPAYGSLLAAVALIAAVPGIAVPVITWLATMRGAVRLGTMMGQPALIRDEPGAILKHALRLHRIDSRRSAPLPGNRGLEYPAGAHRDYRSVIRASA